MVRALLVVHIGCGIAALVSGTVATLSKKGGRAHRRAGTTFLLAVGGICITAIPIALVKSRTLLLYLSALAFYLAASGRLALARKGRRELAPALHRALAVGFAAVSVAFMPVAFVLRDPLLGIFSLLGLVLAVRAARVLGGPPPDSRQWLIDHAVGFGGAYTATVTAFAVVNAGAVAPRAGGFLLIAWLGPTILGLPILRRTTARLRKPT